MNLIEKLEGAVEGSRPTNKPPALGLTGEE